MVTNAGVLRDAVLWKMTDEDFDLVVRTHLRGTFLCARAAAIRLREQGQGGRIIVVGSPAGQYGNFGQTNYAAAKAGIVALRADLGARARARGDHGERHRSDRLDGDDRDHPDLQAAGRARRGRRAAARAPCAASTPSGTPEDCAGLVVFLASNAAAGISGQAIGIGGDRLCLYSHPAEIVTELRDGGWDADAIAAIWQTRFAAHAQPVGVRLPKLEHSNEIDLEAVRAIDVHTHAQVPLSGEPDPRTTAFLDAAAKHFRSDFPRPNAQEVADYYRARSMAAVIFCVDNRAQHRRGAGLERRDPGGRGGEQRRADPVRIRRSASEQRRRGGAPPHPAGGARLQVPPQPAGILSRTIGSPIRFTKRSRRPRLPAVFHTGHSGIGSGMPGGGGIRLKYSNPMYVDDVAVDFPAMPIVLAHPSFPWQEEALSVAMHKAQVYIDLSGWAPKLFPPILVQYVNGPLRTKALFGSDYPVLTPDRWLAEFAELPIRDEVRPLVLKQNAARLLGLARPADSR